jgi:menaquinone-dependent protoporphyrinogen oxidase
MRRISRKEGGDTDTSRDYEYTDWAAVDRFAAEFADEVAGPVDAVTSPRRSSSRR